MDDMDNTSGERRVAAVKLAKARSMANFVRIKFKIIEMSKEENTDMSEMHKLRDTPVRQCKR